MAVCVLAILLFAWTFTYRFNTLGGRFGGFEDDHFVSFAYAKQVEAGAQPLRDFAGLGLQGAWPSLTYEASAAAQRWLGDNLRSEALLTVTGLSVAMALTFLAGASVSNAAWAFVATLLSVFVAPTLYNYTKVLSLAGAALSIVWYARRPTLGTAAANAGITAVAFLFRHDLAAYVGTGALIASLTIGPGRLRWRNTAAYLLFTLALLTPSLIYVQHYDGVITYLRDGLALSQREAERTPLLSWPTFTFGAPGFFAVESNATAWLFYMTWLLPALTLILVWLPQDDRDRRVRPALIALAVTTVFASRFMIRGNVTARLGDVGPLFAVLLAFVCDAVTRPRPRDTAWRRITRFVPVLVLLAGTTLSAATIGSVASQLRTARLTGYLQDAVQHMQRISRDLQADPQTAVNAVQEGDVLLLAQYLSRCIAPNDRVVLMAYRPELLPFAGRLFGAGRLSIIPAYVLDERHQREAVAWWQRESVPVALVGFEAFYDPSSNLAPVMRDYLLAHYADAGIAEKREGQPLRLFVRRDLTPTSWFGSARLPCLR